MCLPICCENTITGGLVGNFTGEADFITPRECLAGNPRVYAQLVNVLRPYSRAQPPAPTADPAAPISAAPAADSAGAVPDPADAASDGASGVLGESGGRGTPAIVPPTATPSTAGGPAALARTGLGASAAVPIAAALAVVVSAAVALHVRRRSRVE